MIVNGTHVICPLCGHQNDSEDLGVTLEPWDFTCMNCHDEFTAWIDCTILFWSRRLEE